MGGKVGVLHEWNGWGGGCLAWMEWVGRWASCVNGMVGEVGVLREWNGWGGGCLAWMEWVGKWASCVNGMGGEVGVLREWNGWGGGCLVWMEWVGRWVSCMNGMGGEVGVLREWFVCWLLNVPATCKCISGMDLLRQEYVLPHWDRSCRPNFPSHPVTVYWHQVHQSQCWPYNARRLAG